MSRVPPPESALFGFVNGASDGWRPVVRPVMQLGNFWMTLAGPAGAWALWRRPEPALAAATATFSAWGLAKAIKHHADRGRPADLLDGVHLRDGDITGLGFVSGHAAVAFALATAIAPWLPSTTRPMVFGLAGAVGLSRLYVGAHLPLDVVGGAALGTITGVTTQVIFGTPAPRSTGPS